MEIHTAVPPGAHKVHGLSHPPDGFHIRAAAFLPAHVEYVQRVLERLGIDPSGSRALVAGSGRGLLARELARVGFVVSALDPAADAVRRAEEDGLRDGLPVDHQVGDAERLPYGDGVFDVAYYQDTLETVDDLGRVLSEAARVLRAGGAFLYDTVNRSALSRRIYLGALQSWRWTRIMPRDRYAWERLRPPDDLAASMSKYGLRSQDVSALMPASPLRLIRAMLQARRGRVDDAELAGLAGMHVVPGRRPDVTYLGFATTRELEV